MDTFSFLFKYSSTVPVYIYKMLNYFFPGNENKNKMENMGK